MRDYRGRRSLLYGEQWRPSFVCVPSFHHVDEALRQFGCYAIVQIATCLSWKRVIIRLLRVRLVAPPKSLRTRRPISICKSFISGELSTTFSRSVSSLKPLPATIFVFNLVYFEDLENTCSKSLVDQNSISKSFSAFVLDVSDLPRGWTSNMNVAIGASKFSRVVVTV